MTLGLPAMSRCYDSTRSGFPDSPAASGRDILGQRRPESPGTADVLPAGTSAFPARQRVGEDR
jgi:hypothetical protein